MTVPRILVAGLRGGSGKTLISLGLTAAWRKQGRNVAPFKKGPDYIDAAWLTRAAQRPCRNLDLFLMSRQAVVNSLTAGTLDADIAVVEGNRGLFDGLDSRGSYSTAELAKLLQVPVILVVDCTKSTRTIAAIVLGCQTLDPAVSIRGVVLNRVASARHESVLRESVESICDHPVVGSLGRIKQQLFPERHLGLIPPLEHGQLDHSIEQVRSIVEDSLDLGVLWELAQRAADTPKVRTIPDGVQQTDVRAVRVGIFRDAAFQFYYPENLEALERAGAELVDVSPLSDTSLPNVDALYIGGGFPETLAPGLTSNRPFLEAVRLAAGNGLPIYAECGGAVFLGEELVYEGKHYQMSGVLPVTYGFQTRPRGHGYVELEAVEQNPFYSVGDAIRGHEFHYTYMLSASSDERRSAFKVNRGYGFDGHRDGLVRGNVLACYTHVHASGTEQWAGAVVGAATRFKLTTANRIEYE